MTTTLRVENREPAEVAPRKEKPFLVYPEFSEGLLKGHLIFTLLGTSQKFSTSEKFYSLDVL
jgi:hypothetical protein